MLFVFTKIINTNSRYNNYIKVHCEVIGIKRVKFDKL